MCKQPLQVVNPKTRISSILHPFYLYSSMTETRNPTIEFQGLHTKKTIFDKKKFGAKQKSSKG
jgi:hypothetical protein